MQGLVEGRAKDAELRTAPTTVERARSLRRSLTLPEVLLWRLLRRKAIDGLRFRRQHPLGPYVLDFYCPSARLCVEVDGRASHDLPSQTEHDLRRDVWLAEQRIRVLRIPAADILDPARLPGVLETIRARATPSTAVPAVPLPRNAGED